MTSASVTYIFMHGSVAGCIKQSLPPWQPKLQRQHCRQCANSFRRGLPFSLVLNGADGAPCMQVIGSCSINAGTPTTQLWSVVLKGHAVRVLRCLNLLKSTSRFHCISIRWIRIDQAETISLWILVSFYFRQSIGCFSSTFSAVGGFLLGKNRTTTP